MFPKTPKIEDLILEILSNGPQQATTLIEQIKEKRPKTTKQSVYKSLRNLKKDEIIVQTRGHVALSGVWLKKLAAFTEKTKYNYQTENNPSIDFIGLEQGEKISYTFKTFEATDMFWAHTFSVLSDTTPQSSPIFLYNPHEWFLLARPESEVFLFEGLKKIERKLFVIAGHRDPLDLYVEKYFDQKTINYFASPTTLFPKSNYYVNILGDFLIEAWLDPEVSEQINLFYKNTKIFDEQVKNKLLKIVQQNGKNKLTITRNKRKADTIRRLFGKMFIL